MFNKIKNKCRTWIINIVKEACAEEKQLVEELVDKNKGHNDQMKQDLARIEQKMEVSVSNLKANMDVLTAKLEQNDILCTAINNDVVNMNSTMVELLNGMLPYLELLRDNGEETVTNLNSLFSYCINETIKNQVDIEETYIYKYYRKLHELTRCYSVSDKTAKKCRVGKMHDGGYVMLKPFSRTKIAYSLGISDDVSWDKEMADNGYEIYQYDHTIKELPEENQMFHWKKIGLTGLEETDELKRIETIITDNDHENIIGMILKMDIEGFEWDILNTCSEQTLSQFDQIVLEVHGLNDLKNAEKILEGLKKLTMQHTVVHVHGNNYRYSTFCGDMITPDVMELTLVKKGLYSLIPENDNLIENIDEVNRPNSQDIWIGKW